MKRLFLIFPLIATLIIVVSSCDPKETSDRALGDVVSATYDAATRSFIVKYSEGGEKSYPAVIDNTVDPPTAGYALDDKTYLYAADAAISGDATISKEVNTVSQFVYDGMSTYYFWADDVINKQPKLTDVDPENYFYKILHSTDTQKGWSWITDDVNGLLAGFEGKSLSFGYDLSFTMIGNDVFAIIKYVHPNTPAARAGLQRLDWIGELNGQPITTVQRGGNVYISDQSIGLLYGNNTVTFSTYKISGNQIIPDKEVTITPDDSNKDPVLYDNIYTIGNKKIGYLFYTDFYDSYNYRLYEVFNKFKQSGVTDLVLDLRYNTGGAVSSAIYLASLIAPKTTVENKSPFVVMNYNNLLNTSFDKWYNEAAPADKYKYDRKEYLGVYDNSKDQNPLNANLDLNTVYIIATGGSYSASELVTFCLEPYINVVHIGGNTGGKYTASWTIHGYDDEFGIPVYDETKLSSSEKNKLKNWAMQPIVAMYANKDSKNFSNPGYLIPDHKLEEGFGYIDYWTPLGDTKDVLLGQALYLISGDVSYLPVQPRTTRSTPTISKEIINSLEEGKPVIMDNIKLTAEDFQKLQQLRN
ncbi:S41 family peptidase [Proteiniphilum acetatigenes]|uniref:S41 family peptidase n=1 Tax=Proteiniphilum acetatigenes TaxID=294710 RepID=UPI00037D3A45|nr:S41 family peptidase [Proteiniphilum acetatigenes]